MPQEIPPATTADLAPVATPPEAVAPPAAPAAPTPFEAASARLQSFRHQVPPENLEAFQAAVIAAAEDQMKDGRERKFLTYAFVDATKPEGFHRRALIFKAPSRKEYQGALLIAQKPGAGRIEADAWLITACRVYPDEAAFNQLLEARPAIMEEVADTLRDMAGSAWGLVVGNGQGLMELMSMSGAKTA